MDGGSRLVVREHNAAVGILLAIQCDFYWDAASLCLVRRDARHRFCGIVEGTPDPTSLPKGARDCVGIVEILPKERYSCVAAERAVPWPHPGDDWLPIKLKIEGLAPLLRNDSDSKIDHILRHVELAVEAGLRKSQPIFSPRA